MEARSERIQGILTTVTGLATIVFAVMLVGLTKPSGGIDWISVIAAVAGLVLAGLGLSRVVGHRGTGATAGGPTPHAAS